MLMSDAGTCFDLASNYRVELPPGDHLLVVAGGQNFHFDHRNLSARVPGIWEFKHYHPQRGKWWTQRAGIDLYFVIPKHRIELLREKGYSYVPVQIAGRNFKLNVSGGSSSNGWTDYVRSQVRTQVGLPRFALQALATAALSPEEVLSLGLGFDVKLLDDELRQTFQALAVKRDVQQAQIKRLVLGRSFSCRGKQGPFDVVSRSARHRAFTIEDDGWRCRTTYSQIDWLQTAVVNEIAIPNPTAMNRVGSLEEASHES